MESHKRKNKGMSDIIPDLAKLLERPIAFQQPYAQIAGFAAGGLFLSQALYWTGKSERDGQWFYKTQDEWHKETWLSRSEQERSRKALKKAGVLEEKRKGNPAKLWYRVNRSMLNAALFEILENQQFAESSKQECRNQQTRVQDSTNKGGKAEKTIKAQQEKSGENQQFAESDNLNGASNSASLQNQAIKNAEINKQECRNQQTKLQDSANITESTSENTSESTADTQSTDTDADAAAVEGELIVQVEEPPSLIDYLFERGTHPVILLFVHSARKNA
ncbi:hypothetical protein, partial [Sansalvadorimonas verongulae]|uniref:hypothetical protein n=1 Tax=Sansalvadorimonas verongulae TaxID=2172824 RepID=UPI001E36A7ED